MIGYVNVLHEFKFGENRQMVADACVFQHFHIGRLHAVVVQDLVDMEVKTVGAVGVLWSQPGA